jgi:hypothetical protein
LITFVVAHARRYLGRIQVLPGRAASAAQLDPDTCTDVDGALLPERHARQDRAN